MVHVLFKPQGDCSMLPCVRCIIPFLLFVCTEDFQTRYHRLAKSEFYSLLGIQGMLEGFESVIPSFLKTESMQSKNHSVWVEARDPELQRKQSRPAWPSAGENQFHKLDLAQFTPRVSPSTSTCDTCTCGAPSGPDFSLWKVILMSCCCLVSPCPWYNALMPQKVKVSLPPRCEKPKTGAVSLRYFSVNETIQTLHDLTHCSWGSYCKTGGNSVPLHSSSTYINIAIFVFEIDLKLNQVWNVLKFQAALTTPQETITSHRFSYFLLKNKLFCLESQDRP